MEEQPGYVYIFQNGDENLYKIGFSKDWTGRLKHLRIGNPHLKLRYADMVLDAHKVEQAIHSNYAGNKIYGEFFSFEEQAVLDIITFIEENKSTMFVSEVREEKREMDSSVIEKEQEKYAMEENPPEDLEDKIRRLIRSGKVHVEEVDRLFHSNLEEFE